MKRLILLLFLLMSLIAFSDEYSDWSDWDVYAPGGFIIASGDNQLYFVWNSDKKTVTLRSCTPATGHIDIPSHIGAKYARYRYNYTEGTWDYEQKTIQTTVTSIGAQALNLNSSVGHFADAAFAA